VPQPGPASTASVDDDAKRTMEALDELASVLGTASADLRVLALRARALRAELADGDRLTEAMQAEPRPLIITRMTELVDALTTAALAVRRAEARQLQREGASQQQIAEIFGVTRQRVAALLAGPGPDAEARRPHRPRPRGQE
jgi:hypothetical protein